LIERLFVALLLLGRRTGRVETMTLGVAQIQPLHLPADWPLSLRVELLLDEAVCCLVCAELLRTMCDESGVNPTNPTAWRVATWHQVGFLYNGSRSYGDVLRHVFALQASAGRREPRMTIV